MDVTKYLIILILIDTQLILHKFLLMNILCFATLWLLKIRLKFISNNFVISEETSDMNI
jgi:hypothetical protein